MPGFFSAELSVVPGLATSPGCCLASLTCPQILPCSCQGSLCEKPLGCCENKISRNFLAVPGLTLRCSRHRVSGAALPKWSRGVERDCAGCG